MYQSSASSSSSPRGGGGLARNGSAPGSLLSSAAAGAGLTHLVPARFFPPEACDSSAAADDAGSTAANTTIGLRPSTYGFCVASSSPFPPSLVRHSSSPAVFINQLAAADKNGRFPITRSFKGCNQKGIRDNSSAGTRLSFNRSDSLSRISEESDRESGQMKLEHSNKHQPRFEATHPILFPVEHRSKTFPATASHLEGIESQSQLQFSMSQPTMGVASMDKLLSIPLDSVPCKIRAKRGCATHPRSIAERERRTRITGKLKKLQDLVPNMDKQTSYADMLDLAVKHIKSLQCQVQKLNKDLDGCSCGSKRNRNL